MLTDPPLGMPCMATNRQRIAVQKMVENGGNVSKAMKEAGYTKQTAKTPQKLTESKGFAEIMEEAGITDFKLSQVLRDGLEATKAVVMGKESTDSFVDVQPDFAIRHKYLETGLKMKGLIPKEQATGNFIQINNTIGDRYAD